MDSFFSVEWLLFFGVSRVLTLTSTLTFLFLKFLVLKWPTQRDQVVAETRDINEHPRTVRIRTLKTVIDPVVSPVPALIKLLVAQGTLRFLSCGLVGVGDVAWAASPPLPASWLGILGRLSVCLADFRHRLCKDEYLLWFLLWNPFDRHYFVIFVFFLSSFN